MLMGDCSNLAVNGEDIYYHFCVLKKAYDVYLPQIDDLKYAVIDLWDYPVFNLDLSMSSGLLQYFNSYGFMEDLHNYSKNSLYKMDIDSEMQAKNFYASLPSERDKSIADAMFDMSYVRKSYDRFFRVHSLGNIRPTKSSLYWEYRVEDEYDTGISANVGFPHHGYLACTKTYYGETNTENKETIRHICQLLKQVDPDLQIYFILMPRYVRIEDLHNDNLRMTKYKKEFLAEMARLKKEFGANY